MRWFWIVSVVALFYGCGGDDHPEQFVVPTGGRSNTGATGGRVSTGGAKNTGGSSGSVSTPGGAGAGGDGGGGGEGGADPFDPHAPAVEITSPLAVSDPDDGEVLLKDNVDVLCLVTKSTAAGSLGVNAASIKIAMLDRTGKVLKELAGTTTSEPNVYTAAFAVANLTNGPVSFRCAASDLAATPHTRTTLISTFVDRGPDISDVVPKTGAFLPLMGAVEFEFTVEPAPLADGDKGAEVSDVMLTVLGLPVEVMPAPGRPSVYLASVDFTDATLFPEAPTGDIPVVITATNSREPTSAVRTYGYTFKLDGDGPVISINKPAINQILGPPQQFVEFTVTDSPSGVDKNTVTVTLNGKAYVYEPPPSAWTEKNGTYTFKFDATKLNGSIAQATINVHATDTVGNKAEGQARVVYLDDYPPIVSLDPSPIRIMFRATSTTTNPKCSSVFDPLGEAVSDGDAIQAAAMFRAFVWDETNYAPGQTVVRYAGPDTSSVRLYLQPDTTQPLLLDEDGDGACDHVATRDKNGKELVLLTLAPLPKAGTVPNTSDDRSDPPPAPQNCDRSGTTNPNPLCKTTTLTYVARHAGDAQESVVYGLNPKANDLECAGNTWEVPGLAGYSGWICLAASASDTVGNEGISSPLRVCTDYASKCAGLPKPTCTDGCVPPLEFPSVILQY